MKTATTLLLATLFGAYPAMADHLEADTLPEAIDYAYWSKGSLDTREGIGLYLDHGDSPSGTPQFILDTTQGTYRTNLSFGDPGGPVDWGLWENTQAEFYAAFKLLGTDVVGSSGFTVYTVDEDRNPVTGDDADWATLGWWAHTQSGGEQIGAFFDGSHYHHAIDIENLRRDVRATYKGMTWGLYSPGAANPDLAKATPFFSFIDLGVTIYAAQRQEHIGAITGTVHTMRVGDNLLGNRVIDLGTAGIVPDGSWEVETDDLLWTGDFSDHALDNSLPPDAGGIFRAPLGDGLVHAAYLASDCTQADCESAPLP